MRRARREALRFPALRCYGTFVLKCNLGTSRKTGRMMRTQAEACGYKNQRLEAI
jgi:hypothetical protein